jgi:hypothetical protein
MDKVTSIGTPKKKRVRRSSPPARSRSSAPSQTERWEKAKDAYQLRISGKLPSEIAEILGFAHTDDVSRLLDERYAYDAAYLSDQQRKSILALELVRLEHLQAAVWPAAMMGDPKSVDSALRIIQTRARITGLEQVDPVVNKNLVLVMGEKEEDYIRALRAAGAGQED